MSIAIIGFGEVGAIFAGDLHAGGAAALTAYDIAASARGRIEADPHVALAGSTAQAVADADMVLVTVTAGQTLAAIDAVAAAISPGAFVADFNSVAPQTKIEAGRRVEAAGGRYVEAAVMASVPPKRLKTPMLLGGPHAAAWIEAMAPYGMALKIYSPTIGSASAVKMCRSVLIKGMETLFAESLLAARHYGVEDDVLASLRDTFPHPDAPKLAQYMIERAVIHGVRRSEEMDEVAVTVAQSGLEPMLSSAISRRQAWAAEQGRKFDPPRSLPATLDGLLDALLHASRAPAAQAGR